jgi:hypothetical protein
MTPIIRPIPYYTTPMTEYEKEQATYAQQDALIRAKFRADTDLLTTLLHVLLNWAQARASRRTAPTRRLRLTSSR